MQAVPPQFCWVRAEMLALPDACPADFFRSLALCYRNCQPGYRHVLGVCWQDCPNGYADHGATCYKSLWNWDWFWKHSYIPESLTNFSELVQCPPRYRKEAAHCKIDCDTFYPGYVNCGLACAASGSTCAWNIFSMVFDTIVGIASFVAFVLTAGASSQSTLQIKGAVQAAGQTAVRHGAKEALKTIVRQGKDRFVALAKTFWKGYLKDQLISVGSAKLAENYCDKFFADQVDKIINGQNASPDTTALDKFTDFIDLIGVKNLKKECEEAAEKNTYVENLECAKAVMTTISSFDPTGLVGIAATFMHPVCEKPEAIPPLIIQKKPNETIEYNLEYFSECFFQGESKKYAVTVSNDDPLRTYYPLPGNKEIKSWKIGKNLFGFGYKRGPEHNNIGRFIGVQAGEIESCAPLPVDSFQFLRPNDNCVLIDYYLYCENYTVTEGQQKPLNWLMIKREGSYGFLPVEVRFIHPNLELSFKLHQNRFEDDPNAESLTITKNENLYYPDLTTRHGVTKRNISNIRVRKINK